MKALCSYLLFVIPVSGKPLAPNYIVGGDYVKPGSYPWLVNRKNMCGGGLIAPNWFVTAGHCDMVVGEFVDFNRFDMLAPEPLAERHQVAELVVYPTYDILDTRTDLHDLQLVRLATSATHTPLARLATAEEIPYFEAPGFMLTVAGWGSSSPEPTAPTVTRLRATQVPVISNKVCNDSQHYGANSPPWLPKRVYDTMLCAGFEQGGHDSCLGDSGVPLFVEVNGTGVLIGIVSWAVGCARAFRPGVYTRLSAYRSWIEQTINDSNKFMTQSTSMSSCVNNCGEPLSLCSCDETCRDMNDCCPDYFAQCVAREPNVIVPSVTTCANRCDAVDDGCRCDANCIDRADCCVDYYQFCYKVGPVERQRSNAPDSVLPIYYGSCENVCGTLSSLVSGGYCYCDPNCYVHADCCGDFTSFCISNATRTPTLAPTLYPTWPLAPPTLLPSLAPTAAPSVAITAAPSSPPTALPSAPSPRPPSNPQIPQQIAQTMISNSNLGQTLSNMPAGTSFVVFRGEGMSKAQNVAQSISITPQNRALEELQAFASLSKINTPIPVPLKPITSQLNSMPTAQEQSTFAAPGAISQDYEYEYVDEPLNSSPLQLRPQPQIQTQLQLQPSQPNPPPLQLQQPQLQQPQQQRLQQPQQQLLQQPQQQQPQQQWSQTLSMLPLPQQHQSPAMNPQDYDYEYVDEPSPPSPLQIPPQQSLKPGSQQQSVQQLALPLTQQQPQQLQPQQLQLQQQQKQQLEHPQLLQLLQQPPLQQQQPSLQQQQPPLQQSAPPSMQPKQFYVVAPKSRNNDLPLTTASARSSDRETAQNVVVSTRSGPGIGMSAPTRSISSLPPTTLPFDKLYAALARVQEPPAMRQSAPLLKSSPQPKPASPSPVVGPAPLLYSTPPPIGAAALRFLTPSTLPTPASSILRLPTSQTTLTRAVALPLPVTTHSTSSSTAGITQTLHASISTNSGQVASPLGKRNKLAADTQG